MCKTWRTYLLWFAQEHVDFRYAEIDSILSLFKINMKFLKQPKDEPYWLVQFYSEADVKSLASRSVSLRNCIELWGHADNLELLHNKLQTLPHQLIKQHFQPNKSFKIEVETFCRHFTHKEKVEKLESFSYLPAEGPVNLKNPDVTFQYIEYYGTVANNPPKIPYAVFFGRLISCGLRQLIQTLSLKSRKFIGNTSMDPQLSLLMANQAKIKNGDIIVDPFVGSGSLLVAAAEFGGHVFGTDIDFLMLHARTRPSRIKQKIREKDESIKANMQQYQLGHKYLDVLVNDFATPFWRENFHFDAVITDPPYGIRESTERIGTNREDYTVKDEHLSTHIPAKIEYGISSIYRDLLSFSAKHLVTGGRLVCWFPVFREAYTEDGLPSHPCMQLVSNSEQIFNKVTSRRLLTFEKTRSPTKDESELNDSEITDFREKYFVVREETRKERRMKKAYERKENMLKHLDKK